MRTGNVLDDCEAKAAALSLTRKPIVDAVEFFENAFLFTRRNAGAIVVHLKRHAELARSLGVPETLVAENGVIVEVDADGMRAVDRLTTGRVHRRAGTAIDDGTLRQRTAMARQGLVVVAFARTHDGRVTAPAEVLARGIAADAEPLVDEARRSVARTLDALEPGRSVGELLDAGTRAARRVFEDALGWRPVVEGVVTQLGR